jgi:hypothetical protein
MNWTTHVHCQGGSSRQCAARLRILHRPGRSPRRQRDPVDQDRCRAAQRADVPRPTGSERSENSRGDHVCSRSGSRASIGRTPSNRIRPCGELMPPGLLGQRRLTAPPAWNMQTSAGRPTQQRWSSLRACLEMAADITDDRALGGNLRLIRSPRRRCARPRQRGDRMTGSLLELER